MKKLPLSWNWKRRAIDWQLEELLESPHMVPTLYAPAREVTYTTNNQQQRIDDSQLLDKAQDMNLPVIFRAENVLWNPSTFSYFQQFSNHPLDYNDHGWLVEKKTLSPADVQNYFPNGIDPNSLPVQVPGREHYVIELNDDGSANYLDTNTKHITGFSKIGLYWAYKMGYLHGTTDVVRNAAEVYPDPPMVLFADNDEVGNDWMDIDIRSPREFSNYQDYVNFFNGTSGQLGGRHPLQDDTTKQITAYVSAFNINQIWKGDHNKIATTMLYYEFNRGFRDGLATHSKHWANVAGWMNYNQKGEEARDNAGSSIHINSWVGYNPPQNGKHRYGATGSVYFHPWYGQWNWARAIGCMSNTKPYVDMTDLMGGGKPHITLMWENNGYRDFPKPDREQWKSLIRSNMWINDVEYVGHWVGHGVPRESELITIYWDEVKKCVEEVHNNEVLLDFWQNGTIIRSIDCCPSYKQKSSNLLYAYPWYFNYVEEHGRYDGQQVPRPEVLDTSTDAQEVRDALIDQGRYGDKWKRSLSNDPDHEVKVISWTSKLDNQLLLFAAGLIQDYTDVHIKVDVDNVVKDYVVNAPIGGAFYVIDIDTGNITVIDPRA
jgi:hypothetical protein